MTKKEETRQQSERREREARSSSPVVGRAGFIYLHHTVVFVSWVVRRKDVHLVPLLGLLPVEGEEKGRGSTLVTEEEHNPKQN